MTIFSYDHPDTATRKYLREALDLRMQTLKAHLLLKADTMIELSTKLIHHDEPSEIWLIVHDLDTELRGVIKISEEMTGILIDQEGL